MALARMPPEAVAALRKQARLPPDTMTASFVDRQTVNPGSPWVLQPSNNAAGILRMHRRQPTAIAKLTNVDIVVSLVPFPTIRIIG